MNKKGAEMPVPGPTHDDRGGGAIFGEGGNSPPATVLLYVPVVDNLH